MLRCLNLLLLAFVITSSSLIDSNGLFAQPIWLDRSQDKTISLEILKPDFEGDDRTTFATTAWFLSGRFTGRDRISWAYEIPFAHYGIDSEFGEESKDALGNPYLGMEVHSKPFPFVGEFGFRLPLAPESFDDAAMLGYYTDFVDRAEAFVPDALPISGIVNYLKKEPSGFFSRVRGGMAAWIAIGDRDESEWFLLYSAQVGYESPQGDLVAGISGRWLLSGEDLDFGEATVHQLGLAAGVAWGTIQPGISLRVPLDEDLRDILDFVFGLTLGIRMD